MIVIPAVDLLDGKAVRLFQGDPARKTVFSHDPVETARGWYVKGAQRLHIVDLNGSFSGTPVNRDLIQAICKAVPIPIQLGGGIRDLETIEACLSAGVERIILGTVAVDCPERVEEACRLWPGHIAVAVDARGGWVTVKGWTESTSVEAVALAERFRGMGVSALIYTDVERDGMRKGMNLTVTRKIAKSVDIPLIASGGVASLEDIRALTAIASDGIEGVIVGRALYEGAFLLEDAMRVCR